MDKRQRRTEQKQQNIISVALELFAAHGVDRVSMDEIAAKAHVSKVTMYHYFGSKEELYARAIKTYIDETLAATEKLFDSDLDFPTKLKRALLMKVSTSPLVTWSYLLQVWETEGRFAQTTNESIQKRVKSLMYRLFEEGKAQGYIEDSLSFDLFYLYSEIFRAGVKAKLEEMGAVLADHASLEKLIDLHFFGFIRRL